MLLLFLMNLLTLTFTIRLVEAKYKIWTVDDGTADFHSIQEAIDMASSEDTIVVFDGYYTEGQINVIKPLTLMADENVTVDGLKRGRAVFYVKSDSVNLKGFRILNGGYAGISLQSDNCEVVANIITNNRMGVLVYVSSNNNIIDNNTTNNKSEFR